MRHKVGGRQLSGSSSHRKALYRNLVTDLLDHEKITTTEPKAKEIRSLAEKMITLGKDKDLKARRQALAFIFDEKVVDKVFDQYAVKYIDRQGGYTRIIKLGTRQGDGAPMVRLELVD
jgi:large subunit ribosomal protein L17